MPGLIFKLEKILASKIKRILGITIIHHKEIFSNLSHLPTFSSSAIEMNLHRIPGLSSNFIYFNDDITLMKPVCSSHFISKSGYHQFYRSMPVQCNENCENKKVANNICEAECDTEECYHDGGDCTREMDFAKKSSFVDRRSFYKASLDFNNFLLNKNFSPKNRRMVPHMPLIRVILGKIISSLPANDSL